MCSARKSRGVKALPLPTSLSSKAEKMRVLKDKGSEQVREAGQKMRWEGRSWVTRGAATGW